MAKRIMLTGGRAPFTLGLARLFSEAGDIVYVADSVRFPVTRFSNSVTEYFRVPSPRFQQGAYIEELQRIVREKKIDMVIPTCEEVFYIARHKKLFPPDCTVWVDTFEQLEALHNKYNFIEKARGLGFSVPQTRQLTSQKEVEEFCMDPFSGKIVFKPVYSRFASQTIMWNAGAKPPVLSPTTIEQWVAQEYIDGKELCTYGLAKEGQLLAHAAYQPQQRWGLGSSLVFESIDYPTAVTWVQKFARDLKFTGQISFDFIERDGILYPIECNPRATSGVHLFRNTPAFAGQFKDALQKTVTPSGQNIYAMKLPLFVRLFAFRPMRERMEVLRILRRGRDVIWSRRDMTPVWGECVSMGEFLVQSRKLGISANESSSYDIDYNGRDESV